MRALLHRHRFFLVPLAAVLLLAALLLVATRGLSAVLAQGYAPF